MSERFSHGSPGTNSYSIHNEFPVKKSFFENHGAISLKQAHSLADCICIATGTNANHAY